MTDNTLNIFDFGELRSLLQDAPDEARWLALCALLTSAHAEQQAERWLPYAADTLAQRWPDALRAVSLDWIKRKRPPVMAQLARSLRIAALSPNALHQLLTMLERGALPLTILDVAQDIPHVEGKPHRLWDVQRHPLHTLKLSSLRLSDALCRQIAAAQATRALTKLTITAGRPTESGLAALCSAPLKTLELRAWSGQHGARIGRAMCEAKLWQTLESLRATATSLGGAIAPMTQARWEALRELSCDRAELTHEELRALLTIAPGLEALSLPVNNVGSAWIAVIMESQARLRALDLSWSKPAPGDLAQLLQSAPCAALRALTLRACPLDAPASLTLLTMTSLERLELGDTTLDRTFWERLSGASLPALTCLDLRGQVIEGEQARALRDAALPALRSVLLTRDKVAREAMSALDEAPWHQAIELSA